jgi:GNAT superfamily N-acetyltransferase
MRCSLAATRCLVHDIVIREANPSDYIDQIRELTQDNWRETGFDFPLDINVAMYEALYAAGCLICQVALDRDNEVIGYSTAFVGPHPFNPAVVMCESNALFVHRDFRSGVVPGRLIVETERAAKRKGATRMSWNTRAGTSLAAIFARRGYYVADQVVMRGL